MTFFVNSSPAPCGATQDDLIQILTIPGEIVHHHKHDRYSTCRCNAIEENLVNENQGMGDEGTS
jgi:hypothetical protein